MPPTDGEKIAEREYTLALHDADGNLIESWPVSVSKSWGYDDGTDTWDADWTCDYNGTPSAADVEAAAIEDAESEA